MTLTEFLLARIADDEAVARAANGPRWASGDGNVSEGGLYSLEGDSANGWTIAWFELGTANEAEDGSRQLPRWPKMPRYAHENSVHAARHDPARVLAECEAKRRLLTEIDEYEQDRVQSLLALPYTDHPAYDEAWRP